MVQLDPLDHESRRLAFGDFRRDRRPLAKSKRPNANDRIGRCVDERGLIGDRIIGHRQICPSVWRFDFDSEGGKNMTLGDLAYDRYLTGIQMIDRPQWIGAPFQFATPVIAISARAIHSQGRISSGCGRCSVGLTRYPACNYIFGRSMTPDQFGGGTRLCCKIVASKTSFGRSHAGNACRRW